MKKNMKQWLSALLVIAMMASLLVVPAAAAAAGTTWEFTDTKWETPGTIDGLVLSGIKKEGGKNHLAGKAGDSVTVPVDGPCDVEVTYYYDAAGTIGTADS